MDKYNSLLIKNVKYISENCKKVSKKSVKDALSLNKKLIYDLLFKEYEKNEEIKNNAIKYYKKRELYNKKIHKICKTIMTQCKHMLKDVKFKYKLQLMSSFPSFNIINDSDLDIGLFVENLDSDKIFELAKICINNDFKPTSITINKQDTRGSNIYRFENIFLGIECEIKIRNLGTSLPLLNLLYRLNNKATEKELIFWTYHKYLLKKISKENKSLSYLYSEFKYMLYHYYFIGIKNNYTFY
jgi:hypothetical protein